MTIKRDPSGRRSIQAEAEVPGTPEEVWEAIATGPGIGSWFYPTELEERVGGVLKYHTGSEMVHVPARVTVWDPPWRFRHEGKDCGPEGPPTATEWIVEPRSRGCVVRMVHGLFASTGDWDNYLKSFEDGWPQALAILRLYLPFPRSARHHRTGLRKPRRFSPRCLAGPPRRTRCRRARSRRSLGTRRGRGCGPRGILDELRPEGRQPYVLLRLDRPAPAIAAASAYKMSTRAAVMLSLYLYGGEDAPAARAEVFWQAWVKARFP